MDCAGDAHHPVASRPGRRRPPPASVDGGADSVDSSGGPGPGAAREGEAGTARCPDQRRRGVAVARGAGEAARGEGDGSAESVEGALGHHHWLLKELEEEDAAAAARGVEEEEECALYPCYREGWQGLARARVEIAKFSMARAASRITRAKRRRDVPDEEEGAEMDRVLNQAKGFNLSVSEIGDGRPLSGCSFSIDGKLLATRYGYTSLVEFFYLFFFLAF